MKVVASTKLTRAEKAMREAKKYGGASNGMCRDIINCQGSVGGRYVLGVKKPKRHARVGVVLERDTDCAWKRRKEGGIERRRNYKT